MKLAAPKPKILPAIHPNEGLQAAYREKLERLVNDLHASLMWWVRSAYRANAPEMAQDESPAEAMRKAMAKLARQWQDNFAEAAPELGKWFATSAVKRSDSALQSILKRAGFSVKFTMTRAANDILRATTEENVILIRDIGTRHMTEISGLVMRSVASGRDLAGLTDELEKRYGITRKRAAFIAHDQNDKATGNMEKARQLELGIVEAKWIHSRGAKHPRPSHVAANGTVYKVAEGCYIDGEYIWPKQKIGCFPGDMPVTLENGVLHLWRAHFHGPMIHVYVGTDLLKGTPNHPVLTARGWVPLGLLNEGDDVVCMAQQRGDVVRNEEDHPVTTFHELFETLALHFGADMGVDGRRFDFHGDLPDGDVDQISLVNDDLPLGLEAGAVKDVVKLLLTHTDGWMRSAVFGGEGEVLGEDSTGLTHLPISDLRADAGVAEATGLAGCSDRDAIPQQDIANVGSGIFLNAQMGSDLCSRHAGFVEPYDVRRHRVPVDPSNRSNAPSAQLLAEVVRREADRGSRVFHLGARLYEFRSVVEKSVRDFSGHVFTMETTTGNYSVSAASVQAKNCGCLSRSIIPGFS